MSVFTTTKQPNHQILYRTFHKFLSHRAGARRKCCVPPFLLLAVWQSPFELKYPVKEEIASA
jgi:hypothetical protein